MARSSNKNSLSWIEMLVLRFWRRPGARICLGLVAITFVVFGQTLRDQFINFGDDDYLYKNQLVSQGLTAKGVAWAFTHFYNSNWHPLTWLSHMLDCQMYGSNPAGHHLTNVLLHTGAVLALFLILRQLTGAMWRSAFVAAVFAVHPLRVESVAWVAERKDVLSGLFFMLTIGAYVRFARKRDKTSYVLCAVFFTLGLMAKPMLVTVPAVLLLLDYWPLQRTETMGRLVLEKLPMAALSAACCIVTFLARATALEPAESISLPLRLLNAITSCGVYLGEMLWPARLAVFYPFPAKSVFRWEFAASAAALAAISALAIWQRRKRPWLLMGWLWYLVMLLPVLGIIQAGNQAHADRYTYLPQIGIYIAITWTVAQWGEQWRWPRRVFAGVMATVVAALMVAAALQATYWKDSLALWAHVLNSTSHNDVAHYRLAQVLDEGGDSRDAIVQYKLSLQIKPGSPETLNDLGSDLLRAGQLDQAIVSYQLALRLRPKWPLALNNLGYALVLNGKLYDAIAEFQKALAINPNDVGVRNNLGDAFIRLGKIPEAIAEYQAALKIDPDAADIRGSLDRAMAQARRNGSAGRGR